MQTNEHDEWEKPHAVWWLVVLGGLTLLAFQGFDATFYAWWISHMHGLPGRSVMMWIFIACVPIHVYEAVYVFRTARRLGMTRSQRAWTLQTFFLGFPSTYLFLKRTRSVRAAEGARA
jgi:hypothetical protein